MSVRPAKTQIRLGIRPVWSESSLSAWRNLGPLATHWAYSEDSDQTRRMPRLIWVFAGRTLILLVLSCRGSINSFWGSSTFNDKKKHFLPFWYVKLKPRALLCMSVCRCTCRLGPLLIMTSYILSPVYLPMSGASLELPSLISIHWPGLDRLKSSNWKNMSPVKRICVFQHSVMTNFNCACPAI